MKIEPLVSVIVAVSVNEETIYGCIESIMNQSYRNLEIILVVDYAFDRISIICENLSMMDSRIRIVSFTSDKNKNDDLEIAAYYEGLRYALGTYVTFVDSNDRLHYDMIRSLTGICIKHKCQIACCKTDLRKKNKPLCYTKTGKVRIYKKNGAFLSRKFSNDLYGKLFDIALFEELSRSDFCFYPLYYRADRISMVDRYMYYRHTENRFECYIKLRFDAVIKYYKDRIRYFRKKDRNLLELSHEYYCDFLADYYIHLLKSREEVYGLEKIYLEFRKEFCYVRYSAVTPVYTKLRLGLLYYVPKLYGSVLAHLCIDRERIIIKKLKRL